MQKFLSNYKVFYIYLLTKGYKNVTIILNGFIIYHRQIFSRKV